MKKIFILFILSMLLVACSSKPVTKQLASNNQLPEIKQQSELKQQPIELKNKVNNKFEFSNIVYGSNGVCIVNGDIKNLDNKKHSAILKIVFYDKDDKILETATGSILDIGPNQTKTFLATGTKEVKDAVSVKAEVNSVE